jgi:hypothetical protein
MLPWWIGLAAGGAVLTLNLHELAHCLVVWCIGGTVTSYKPWPHRANGRWFIGRMTWELGRPPTRRECRWFYGIIPLRASMFLAMWVTLGLLVFLPLLALAFWDLMDLGDWIKDYLWDRKTQDAGKFRSC